MAVVRGRRAARPPADWEPPRRLDPAADPLAVRFIEESGRRSRTFDFTDLPCEPGVAAWLARVFAATTGPRGGAKRLASAEGHAWVVRWFAGFLGEFDAPAVAGPAEVTAAHIKHLWLRHGTDRERLMRLRVLLRDDTELAAPAAQVLFGRRLPPAPSERVVGSYDEQEQQVIMTALRRDIRQARDRIRAGQALLADYRAGQLTPGTAADVRGGLLDVVDRTGDLPRRGGDNHLTHVVARNGGALGLCAQLCLTFGEAVAFALMLTAMTGENFGTVARWPAAHYRPDGGDDTVGVALVEAVKPRRGPDREHMVTALEDVPGSLPAALASADPAERRLFRSPLRLYQLLVALTEMSRRHGGHGLAVGYVSTRTRQARDWWSEGIGDGAVHRWAKAHGFSIGNGDDGGRPRVDVRWLRRTVIEQTRKSVAHTPATMNDHYLARSQAVRDDSRAVVVAALDQQVEQARAAQRVPVFTAAFVARAREDLQAAAAQAGLDPAVLRRLLAGEQDTVLAACTDHTDSPHAEPGQPCRASFLSCLDCRNSRALPHHLPIQVAVARRLELLRANLDPAVWTARYGRAHGQLAEILDGYTDAELATAATMLSDRQRRLVDDLLDGRLDLR
jgi:hypothetical protein